MSVQDAAAQRAAPLLLGDGPARRGARVLDACAAPGGKTAHLLELADLDLLALDSDPQRLARVQERCDRLRPAGHRCAPAMRATPRRWWDGRPFDAILLDAPCSASGIVRRHPDVRWLRRARRRRRAGAGAGADARRAVAAARAGRPAAVLHLLGVPGRGQAPDRRFFATPAGGARHASDACVARPPAAAAGQSERAARRAQAGASHDGFFYALIAKATERMPRPVSRIETVCSNGPRALRGGMAACAGVAARSLLACVLAHRRCGPQPRSSSRASSRAQRRGLHARLHRALRRCRARSRMRCEAACRCTSSPRPTCAARAGTGATSASRARRAAWRLAYQPLTSSYRVSYGGLHQTYDTLADALTAMHARRALEDRRRRPARSRRAPLRRVQLPARHHAAAAPDADRHRRARRTGTLGVGAHTSRCRRSTELSR